MTTTEQDDLERIKIQAGEAIFDEGDLATVPILSRTVLLRFPAKLVAKK